MISNARGKHSSPGVYIEEIDKSYSTKSLGVTTLGVIGETLKGPAFEPLRISNWTEFQEYFGGTSTEKFLGTKYPKYELPYIAKSYLQESNQLEVCRILGFSGYDAGPAFIIYGTKDNENDKHIIAVLRSKGSYQTENNEDYDPCNNNPMQDKIIFKVSKVELESSNAVTGNVACTGATFSGNTLGLTVDKNNYGRFVIKCYETKDANVPFETIDVSLNPGDKNYIINELGMTPHEGGYSLFVEELYDMAHIKSLESETYNTIDVATTNLFSNYKTQYREAITPWFVSEIKGSGNNIDLKKLFRFHTISDGNAANYQIKVSITNILPDEGLFDVYIRDYNDTDASPLILERFSKCSMIPGSVNYVGLKIGTYNGEYENKSKYVTVEVIENEITENCVPCGFLGYPLRNLQDTAFVAPELDYNTNINDMIKPNRQFFGMSNVDLDVLKFKGVGVYKNEHTTENGYTNGFHLDSYLSASGDGVAINVTVDGVSGFKFTTTDASISDYEKPAHLINEGDAKGTVYEDKNFRKFTCYPYGGFDGWDIYRQSRTNTDKYRANKYKFPVGGDDDAFTSNFNSGNYGLTGNVISSDYYAYLAGYKQFDNPNKVDINLIATPGIDYVNNKLLVNEVIDIVEDYRQGDCLYIVTTPDVDVDGNSIDPDVASQNFIDSDINTSYGATYYPWVRCYDATDKKYISLPVTKDVVRNFAYTDNVAQPWFASAGMSRGSVDCVKANRFTRIEEEDNLYENMINPVKSFSSDGVKIWGNKTMYHEDTPLNRINVRRLMIRLKKTVMSSVKELIFEQNDNQIAEQFKSIVGSILDNAKQNRGISEYRIQVDTSAEARDRKELPAKIWVKPINSLEYISISFTITPEGASFED